MEGEEQFKGLVTDNNLTINPKGTKAFKATSYHRVMVPTNKPDPLNVSEDERRNFMIRVSDSLRGNKEYFDQLYKFLNDEGTIKAMYDYFMNIPDLDNFHMIDTPITEHQQELAKLDVSPIEQFVKDFVFDNVDKDVVNISSKDLFGLFL